MVWRNRTVAVWMAAAVAVIIFSVHLWLRSFRCDEADFLVWSPDGRWLASGSWDEVRLWHAASGLEVRRLKGDNRGEGCSPVAWSPDGRTLAVGDSVAIRLVDMPTGVEFGSLAGHDNSISLLAWSPDGTMLASEGDDGTVRVWQVGRRKEFLRLDGHALWSRELALAWSPDGKTLAIGSETAKTQEDHSIRLCDVATGKEIGQLEGHREWVYSLAWSPDGKTLASGSSDKTIRLWDVAAGKESHRFVADGANTESIIWSADNTKLASGGCVWEAATGKQLRRLEGLTRGVLSPDGRVVAIHDYRAGRIRLFDTATDE